MDISADIFFKKYVDRSFISVDLLFGSSLIAFSPSAAKVGLIKMEFVFGGRR